MLTRWILPIGFVLLGILILTGNLLQQVPSETGLRTIMGIVVILLGVHRFVAARAVKPQERRFGGEHRRPWEDN